MFRYLYFLLIFIPNILLSFNYNKNIEKTIYNKLITIKNIKKLKEFGKNKYEISYNLIKFVEKEIDNNFHYNKRIYQNIYDKDFLLLLIFSIIKTESNFNKNALGDNGKSFGLMQININTLKSIIPNYYNKYIKYKLNILFNPKYNISFGIFILKKKVDYFYNNLYYKLNVNKYKNDIIYYLNNSFSNNSINSLLKIIFVRYFPFVSMYNGKILNIHYTKKILNNINYYFND